MGPERLANIGRDEDIGDVKHEIMGLRADREPGDELIRGKVHVGPKHD